MVEARLSFFIATVSFTIVLPAIFMGSTIIFTRPFDASLFTESPARSKYSKLWVTRNHLENAAVNAADTMMRFLGGNTKSIEAYRTRRIYIISCSIPTLITRKLSVT